MAFAIRKHCLILAVALTSTSFSGLVLAESDPMARHETKIDVGVRYPGDHALKDGTVRTEGTEKGAYIERCTWSFNPKVSKGFGLTQNCFRYTLKNTR